jgi:hypothetical protein
MAVLPRLVIVFAIALAVAVVLALLQDATQWGPNVKLAATFIGILVVGGSAQKLGLMEPPDRRPF